MLTLSVHRELKEDRLFHFGYLLVCRISIFCKLSAAAGTDRFPPRLECI